MFLTEVYISENGEAFPSITQSLGAAGTHRARELRYRIPKTMQSDEVDYYRFSFKNLEKNVNGYSEPLHVDNSFVSYLIPAAFTKVGTVEVQLEAIGDDGDSIVVLGKTPLLNFTFSRSNETGEEVDDEYSGTILAEITDIRGDMNTLRDQLSSVYPVTASIIGISPNLTTGLKIEIPEITSYSQLEGFPLNLLCRFAGVPPTLIAVNDLPPVNIMFPNPAGVGSTTPPWTNCFAYNMPFMGTFYSGGQQMYFRPYSLNQQMATASDPGMIKVQSGDGLTYGSDNVLKATKATTLIPGVTTLNNSVISTDQTQAATPFAVKTVMDQANAAIALVDTKSPTNHASTATTYGAASNSNYGHAMLANGMLATNIPRALTNRALLSAGVVDLNSYRTEETVIFAGTTAANNFPPGTWTGSANDSYLIVRRITNDTHVIQTLRKKSSYEIWQRYSTSATNWSDWVRLDGVEQVNYICTGVNDDVQLQILLDNFAAPDDLNLDVNLDVKVIGTPGLRTTSPAGANLAIASSVLGRRVFLDFTAANIPPIASGIPFISVGMGANVTIRGLNTRGRQFQVLNTFGGSLGLEDCTIETTAAVHTMSIYGHPGSLVRLKNCNISNNDPTYGDRAAIRWESNGTVQIDGGRITGGVNHGIQSYGNITGMMQVSGAYLSGDAAFYRNGVGGSKVTLKDNRFYGTNHDIVDGSAPGVNWWNISGNYFTSAGIMLERETGATSRSGSKLIFTPGSNFFNVPPNYL